MKHLYIIANWKSRINTNEASLWLEVISKFYTEITASVASEKEIIICPSFPLLAYVSSYIKDKKIDLKVSSQDISKFDEGPHTGEVNGNILKDYVAYCIIGHSERRDSMGETDKDMELKVELANKYGLKPIFCVQNADTKIPEGVEIVSYEPTFAIGTGTADTPSNTAAVAAKIKQNNKDISVLYGGSVTPENVHSFTEKDEISGILVGSKSLDPSAFTAIVENA